MCIRFGGCLKFRPPYTPAAGDAFWTPVVYIWLRLPYTLATRDALKMLIFRNRDSSLSLSAYFINLQMIFLLCFLSALFYIDRHAPE
jgi:hypothetical protein